MTPRAVRKCILCRERPAEVPDREQMGRLIKRVCRQCHGERLRGDLVEVLKVQTTVVEEIDLPAFIMERVARGETVELLPAIEGHTHIVTRSGGRLLVHCGCKLPLGV